MRVPSWLGTEVPAHAEPRTREDMGSRRSIMASIPVQGSPSEAQSWHQWADQFERRVLARLSRRVKYLQRGFAAPALAAPLLLRPAETRYWLLIQNTAAAGQLVISFGMPPNPNANNLTLNPLGVFEPDWVTQDEIWIASAPAAVTGVVIVATVLEE